LENFFAGVLQADPGTVRDYSQIFRLFCHEAQRVFHDRLINEEDKRYFNTILSEMSQKHFSQVGFHLFVCLLFLFWLVCL
jgi:dynein heavy chain